MPATRQSTRDVVRFVLDGQQIELRDVAPTRTVLQYLREDLGCTGTKEGCAEGDCGACTVALAEIDDSGSGLALKAVNSCIQFLPTLDGRELLTVESLQDDALHPVQQAMVDCHASQCGFCTPGFVMSLFVHFKTTTDDSRSAIDHALAGNLCRCTGYQPIVEAARRMYEIADADESWLRKPYRADEPDASDSFRLRMLEAACSTDTLSIDNDGGRFDAPRSSDELAGLLMEHPDATLLAGGTDVGLWVTKQYRDLPHLVYTGRVDDLRGVRVDGDSLDIGAAATLTELMPALHRHFPNLDDLFLRYASPPIRNAATLGGNVANGSPIGDSMPALMALDATLVLRRGDRRRDIPLDAFYLAYQRTALEPSEFVERIRVPLLAAGSTLQSYKVSKRFDQDISAVCGAFRIDLDGNTVADVRLAFGGMAAIPQRAKQAELALRGAAWNEKNVRASMQALARDFQPISDMRASAGYRLQVAQNLLLRCWMEQGQPDTATDVYGYGR